MKKRFFGRSHHKTTDESRFTTAVWPLYDVQVDALHETSSFVSGENGLSFRPSKDGHHQSCVSSYDGQKLSPFSPETKEVVSWTAST
ncbi:unnamed protein product [Protopolystoma xenopodis]|uniref:Uncharacterized protein n=1 Tax=Protopolystoma xenopodis TaxID=117903 RepID=A0A3S5BHG1_9PLAT|nr:unnamed protein product [Protopolystoma xenopodis]